jgi:hypothetical protein
MSDVGVIVAEAADIGKWSSTDGREQQSATPVAQ